MKAESISGSTRYLPKNVWYPKVVLDVPIPNEWINDGNNIFCGNDSCLGPDYEMRCTINVLWRYAAWVKKRADDHNALRDSMYPDRECW